MGTKGLTQGTYSVWVTGDSIAPVKATIDLRK
jgi:hypothetical protein